MVVVSRLSRTRCPRGFSTACAGGAVHGAASSSFLFLSLERPEGLLHHGVIAQRARAVPAAPRRSLGALALAHARRALGAPAAQGVAAEGKVHGWEEAPNGRGLEEEEQKSR